MARLIVIQGADEGRQFDLGDDTLTVGRDAANGVRLHDTEVSRRHAEFVRTADGHRLVDVGSANGTFVNERAVRDVLLRPGDRIQVGQSVLLYSAGRAEPPPGGALAEHISLITRQDLDLPSAIVKTIGESEGSRILSRPERMETAWLKANLGILYEAIQACGHILEIGQLLDRLLELCFRALDPDRGCVLLRRETDSGERGHDVASAAEFEPKAVRWRDGQDRQEKIIVSRTLVEHVLHEKQGLLLSDAARDERFRSAQSIVRAGVREVICVPMRGRHETLGMLYLDSRSPRERGGRLTEDSLALAIALAHQAALAVEETRYYQAMVQAERLAAVGQTIAALSHHIKNILHGLKFGGEMLRTGLDGHDEDLLRKGWNIIEKNQGKVYDLVMDMLSYSKEREPSVEETDLNAVAADVVELLEAGARDRGVKLALAETAALPHWWVDREGIHRALLNIVGNALDAAEEVDGGAVAVRTVREADGGWARLEVEDNGGGIAPEKLAEIFRPFVSSKGARGTGLGLAVSRKILREHGGDIVVSSEVGKGSVFALRIPWRPAPGPQEHQTLVTTPPPAN